MNIGTLAVVFFLSLGVKGNFVQAQKGANMNAVRVRYMVNNVPDAVTFYTKHLGFEAQPGSTQNFAVVSHGDLQLVLSTPFGPGGAAKPMSNGEHAKPGGWNRIIIT